MAAASSVQGLSGGLNRLQGTTRATFSSGVRSQMVHPLGWRELGRKEARSPDQSRQLASFPHDTADSTVFPQSKKMQ